MEESVQNLEELRVLCSHRMGAKAKWLLNQSIELEYKWAQAYWDRIGKM